MPPPMMSVEIESFCSVPSQQSVDNVVRSSSQVPASRTCSSRPIGYVGLLIILAGSIFVARYRAEETAAHFSCQNLTLVPALRTVVKQLKRGMLWFQMHAAVFYHVIPQLCSTCRPEAFTATIAHRAFAALRTPLFQQPNGKTLRSS
jgi:hypothetical protein